MKNFIQLTQKSEIPGSEPNALLLNINNIVSVAERLSYTHIICGTGVYYKVEESYSQVLSLIEKAQ